MSYSNPCTHWKCSCGAKLRYRNRFITKAGTLDRYYVCSSTSCNKIWKSEERLVAFKHRTPPEYKGD